MSRQRNVSLLASKGQVNVTKTIAVRPNRGLSDTISIYLDGTRLSV